MLKKLLKYLSFALVTFLLVVVVYLGPAHWQIRQLTAPLPVSDDIAALLKTANRPTTINVINTANQALPDGTTVAYPAYVLRWSDGRTFLIDAGMTPAGAVEFGLFLERIADAEPLQSLGSVGEQLGDSIGNVAGIAMTHLHIDHTDGARSMCINSEQTIPFYQTEWQANRQNRTTRDGYAQMLDTHCLSQITLPDDDILIEIPGFPGLAGYKAAGHTPGSTIFFAAVDDHLWVIAGDIANNMESVQNNLPKPLAYSLFLTPEDMTRLEDLRLWLAELNTDPGISVVVSHDLESDTRMGIPLWTAR